MTLPEKHFPSLRKSTAGNNFPHWKILANAYCVNIPSARSRNLIQCVNGIFVSAIILGFEVTAACGGELRDIRHGNKKAPGKISRGLRIEKVSFKGSTSFSLRRGSC